MITLGVGATVVTLDPDLKWADELSWHPVQQSVEPSTTGALIIDIGTWLAGRSITLEPEDESSAWMTRAEMEQLQAWAAIPGQQMTLLLRGVVHTVLWRHNEPPAFSAEPVVHYSDKQPEDFYLPRFKFLKV